MYVKEKKLISLLDSLSSLSQLLRSSFSVSLGFCHLQRAKGEPFTTAAMFETASFQILAALLIKTTAAFPERLSRPCKAEAKSELSKLSCLCQMVATDA